MIPVPIVTVEAAREVLWVFGDNVNGWEPGRFMTHLLQAIMTADSENQSRLEREFPAQVQLVDLVQRVEGGMDVLREYVKARR